MSELFDFSIYVDADSDHITQWFVDRFLALRRGAFSNPNSFFNVFAHLTDEEAITMALGFWNDINLPNLKENVLPTKHRATLVLRSPPTTPSSGFCCASSDAGSALRRMSIGASPGVLSATRVAANVLCISIELRAHIASRSIGLT